MAVTATTTTKTGPGVPARARGLEGLGPRPNGNGSKGPRPPGGGGDERPRPDLGHTQFRVGMWIGIAAVAMMFAALTSAYVFRSGMQGWQPLAAPRLLWLSTAVILASSATYELARRALRRGDAPRYRRWLSASLALGLGFLASQLLAWRELVAQGVYLASNPHSSFFYVLTGLHALHLVGGIGGLTYLILRTGGAAADGGRARARLEAKAGAVGIYWHFMDGLWVYLFGLLFFWR
jgi:cytochrome c oxidase subunit III